jgi:hypothetical protein
MADLKLVVLKKGHFLSPFTFQQKLDRNATKADFPLSVHKSTVAYLAFIVLNVHAPSEEKSDESKDSFYEELEQVFNNFPKCHMKSLSGDFNAKVGRENIFKPTIGNESLHQDSNDNGVRVVNFATAKNRVVKSTMFPHRNIHKYTWNSPDGKTHNQIDHILVDRRRHSIILNVRSFRGAD